MTSLKPGKVNRSTRLSDADIRALYGNGTVISRKAGFCLVHLDNPSPATVRQRRRDFEPKKFFCEDCPLCRSLKESGIVVFNESVVDGSGM